MALRVKSDFLTLEAVQQTGVYMPLPFQIGEQVSAWLKQEDGTHVRADCYVVGVHVDLDAATLDLAFRIAGTDLFALVRSPSVIVTPLGMSLQEYSERQNATQAPIEQVAPRRNHLKVVSDNSSEKGESAPDNQRVNKAVPNT